MDGGAWQATVHGAAKSRTGLSNFTHSLTLFRACFHTSTTVVYHINQSLSLSL